MSIELIHVFVVWKKAPWWKASSLHLVMVLIDVTDFDDGHRHRDKL
jgi:hypothetical protein